MLRCFTCRLLVALFGVESPAAGPGLTQNQLIMLSNSRGGDGDGDGDDGPAGKKAPI